MTRVIRLTIAAVLGLLFLPPAHAIPTFIEARSGGSKTSGFQFEVKCEQLPDGTANCRVLVKEARKTFPSDAVTALATVEEKKITHDFFRLRVLQADRQPDVLECTFTLTREEALLKNLCFIIDEPQGGHTITYLRLAPLLRKK